MIKQLNDNKARNLAMNNSNINIIIDILKSKDFKDYIKDIYESGVSSMQISTDICQAINTFRNAVIAEPIKNNKNKIIINLLNKEYNLTEEQEIKNISNNYYKILNFIEDKYIQKVGE